MKYLTKYRGRTIILFVVCIALASGPGYLFSHDSVEHDDSGAAAQHGPEAETGSAGSETEDSGVTAQRILEVERKLVISEISELSIDPQVIKKAVHILKEDIKNTRDDNVEKIYKALATVDGDFASARKSYNNGRYEDAVVALEAVINMEEDSYLSAARQTLYAQALLKKGAKIDALEIWHDMVEEMPDRISFAALAALRSAATFEEMKRRFYAIQRYEHCLENYRVTMPEAEAEIVTKKVEELTAKYGDSATAMATMAGYLETAVDSLSDGDVGNETQSLQQESIDILDDMIKTIEESGSHGPPTLEVAFMKWSDLFLDKPTDELSDTASCKGEDSPEWAELSPREMEETREITMKQMTGRWGRLIRRCHAKRSEEER